MDRNLTSNSLKQTFDRRSFVVGAIQGGIGCILAARMGYIAVAENEKYEMEAESNRVNLTLIPPRRGWILDRNGSPLASNRADFRVDIIPERLHDAERTVELLGELLALNEVEKVDLLGRIETSRGFSAVPVASGLDFDKFAAVSVRLPELPGVVPQRGFSRFYPTGAAVGHLIGYVGAPSREEYDKEPQPLLLTPGFKMGKDGVEQQFEQILRGEPGARRVEVAASGRILRDLDTREDVQGNPIRLTIDGPLQDYAARRLGLESGSVVVMDCITGDLLCMASMPSFDPNSFSDGIGRLEYSMLRENERVPLRNKVLQGLYPPGSTVKPTVGMALLAEGVDPNETVFCGGGLRVGNRVFRCWKRSGHGSTDLGKAIYQSCDVYFYAMAQRTGMWPIAETCRRYGMQEQFKLPVENQFYGTVPDPAWKQEKYGREWQAFDTVNATIGQGYMLASPLQLAVMAARLATSNVVKPRLLLTDDAPRFDAMGVTDEYKTYIRQAMSDVVNGPGTAGRARLPVEDVLMAGKTGTAQVVGLNLSDGKTGPWKYRDHGLFIFFAPFDNPRYAGAVVIEHGGGSGAAYPIARDVMTYLLDPNKGLEALYPLEEQWGGTAQERLDKQYTAYATAAGVDLPPAPPPITLARQVDAEARAAFAEPDEADTDAFTPREDPTGRSDEILT
ncbi:penicillin-binding protein 2 [Aurantiacibacter aquimixticola]|uniref:Penicillin-binding protein 2 n=1 Tax=Aurantiacibacter aquimixticola TaxID=1958945 RepID=A0A419RRM7_9SPHN|nr:penicillin-binding protein 2 [Aurantiacibacter aquimixticola]RJY08435.1 penicillin-binding protein 2 [Aurantiacibacter aquimixticola]